jgi:hypothetical protein
VLIFTEGGKLEGPEKNPCGKGEKQQTTQLTWSTRAEEPTTHWDHGGERRVYHITATPSMPAKIIKM